MPKINTIAIVLAIAFLLSADFPESWSDAFHIGEVPVAAVILACLGLVLIVQVLRKPSALTPGLIWAILALVFTTILGYLRGNVEVYTMKFFVADIFCFAGLLAGFCLVRTQSEPAVASLVKWAALLSGVVIIATYLALFAGLITADINIIGRTVTGSIFTSVGTMIPCLPWVATSMDRRDVAGGWRTWFLFAIAAGTGLLSATRTIVITVVLSGCLYLILKRRRVSTGFVLRLVAGGGLLVLILSSSLFGTYVFSRLGSTDLAGESRGAELSLMWDQINNDVAFGQGMGSRFVSNVVVNGNPLASAPHIGIATFLMKGGVPLFLSYAVLPLLIALKVLFSPRLPERQRGAAAAVVVYVASACLSGGWAPSYLFIYGMGIAAMIPERRRRSSIVTDREVFSSTMRLPSPADVTQ